MEIIYTYLLGKTQISLYPYTDNIPKYFTQTVTEKRDRNINPPQSTHKIWTLNILYWLGFEDTKFSTLVRMQSTAIKTSISDLINCNKIFQLSKAWYPSLTSLRQWCKQHLHLIAILLAQSMWLADTVYYFWQLQQ